MTILRRSIVAFTIAALLTGCGTIVHGTTQEVGFSSDPSGANVEVDGLDKGSTPVTVELSRKDTHTAKFELDGYEPYELTINRKTSGWVAGNIIFGGLIGLVVDASTGGMYKLDPEQVQAQLDEDETASVDGDVMYIGVVMEPDSEWEKVGQLEAAE